MPGPVESIKNFFICSSQILWDRSYYSHFTNKETETKKADSLSQGLKLSVKVRIQNQVGLVSKTVLISIPCTASLVSTIWDKNSLKACYIISVYFFKQDTSFLIIKKFHLNIKLICSDTFTVSKGERSTVFFFPARFLNFKIYHLSFCS